MFVYRRLSLVQVIVLFHFAADYILMTTPGASDDDVPASGAPKPRRDGPKAHLEADATAKQSLAVAQMLQHFATDSL